MTGTFEIKHSIAVQSGTAALHLALKAVGVEQGDNIIIPSPWYFNHKMWLDMMGIKANVLSVDQKMLPSPKNAKEQINKDTKGILLVSPNNPAGVEYPKDLLHVSI